MKKLLTFLLLITALTSSAQVYQNDPSYGRSIDRYEVRKDLGIPTFCGVPTVNSTVTNKAKIAYDSCGGLFYIFNPATQIWSTISGSAFVQDGLISGGIVSWSGSGLTFDITSAVFRKFGVLYNTNDTTITLNAPDLTYSRIDLFALDTSNGGEVIKITGTPSPTPVAPQTQDFQIALTTGITLNVGDTVPSSVSIQKIYDENIEWATSQNGSVTVNFNDVSNPFSGTKDALISSYGDIGRIVFTRSGTGVMDGSEVLKMHISLRDTLRVGRYIRVLFLNNSTPLSSTIVPITKNNGLDPNIVNQYQTIQMPASVFQFTSTTYNRLIIYATGYDTSGTGGFYLDDVELQSGINNVPSQTDISGKVNYTDSLTKYVTPNQLSDTIKSLHNNLNLYWPLYGNNADTSVHFKNDSLPRLTYAPGVDTSGTNAMDVPSKGWVLDRLGSGGGGSINDSVYVNIDTTADGKYFIFRRLNGQVDTIGIAGTDTSHLRNDINANTAAISANTTAIGLKLNITDTAGKWIANAVALNDSTLRFYKGASYFDVQIKGGVSTGGGSSYTPTDTAFKLIRAAGLYSSYNPNKGIRLENPTIDGTTQQNAPPLVFKASQNGNYYWYKIAAEAWVLNFMYSSDSLNFTNGFQLNRLGAINMLGGSASLTTPSYVSAAQFTGTKMSLIGSLGTGVIGANRNANLIASLELPDTTKGLLINRTSKTQKLKIGTSVYAGTITSGGSGYGTGVVDAPFTGGSGTGQFGHFTISGGVITAVIITTQGINYKVGDVLSTSFNGGSGFSYTVTKLSGDTADGLMVIDTTLKCLSIYNKSQGRWENSSTSNTYTASGDGSTTTITIPHGLSNVTSNSLVWVNAKNVASASITYVTIDATNVYIHYTAAPASGTNNLLYDIQIKKE